MLCAQLGCSLTAGIDIVVAGLALDPSAAKARDGGGHPGEEERSGEEERVVEGGEGCGAAELSSGEERRGEARVEPSEAEPSGPDLTWRAASFWPTQQHSRALLRLAQRPAVSEQ